MQRTADQIINSPVPITDSGIGLHDRFMVKKTGEVHVTELLIYEPIEI